MPSRARVWLVACAVLAIVLSPITVAVSALAAPPAPASVVAGQIAPLPDVASAEAAIPASETLHQAYDLLLDNFVTPPTPAALLKAAADEVVKRVAAQVPGEWATPTVAPEATREEAWTIFSTWVDRVAKLSAPSLDRPAVEEIVLRSLAAAVSEHHTRYLDPRQHEDHQAWRRGDVRYDGIGARLRRPSTVVLEVFEGSPAARAGLRTGDRIVAVDGESVVDAGTEGAINRIRGPLGTSVELLVERRGVPEPLRLSVQREEIRIAFVRSEVLTQADGRRIGYLRLRGFPEPSVDERVGRALEEMDSAGIDGLILDLRGNSGGRLDVGIKVVSRFVQDGPVFQQVDRAGRQRIVRPGGGYWQRAVPMVALVDGGTASMGEILSAALQEAGVARVIGTRTSGSVAGARLFPLANGGALQITVLTIVSGRGTVLNDIGVQPDEAVELSDDNLLDGVDAQLNAGLRYLQTTAQPASAPRRAAWVELERAA